MTHFFKLSTLSVSCLLFLTSCAHHKDVRPSAEGIHSVKVQTDDPEDGARNAIEQAQDFCKERNQEAAFIKEEKNYTGDMDEKTYKAMKKAGKAAQVVGGGVWVFGQNRPTKNAGGIVGLGGAAADAVAGEGYTIEMRFKCI